MYTRENLKKIVFVTVVTLLSLIVQLGAEEVGKFAWKGAIDELDNTILETPVNTVAMDEYVYASTFLDNIVEKDPSSIMFIVDNSQSNSDTDPGGNRFKLISELMELIYDKAPETRVGLVMFGSRSWMYKEDDPDLFTAFSSTDSYIPPLGLDEEYSGRYRRSNGDATPVEQFEYTKTGLDVLKMYLETKQDGGTVVSKYIPCHFINFPDNITKSDHNDALTNITIAFEAAKHAHLNQELPLKKNKHFNIFFSDGKAGLKAGDVMAGTVDEYKKGIDVPTTFTFFYESDQDSYNALQLMTSNIKNNGYSNNNKLTQMWNLAGDWDGIKKILVDDVFGTILSKTKGDPTKITINNSSKTNWDDQGFLYDDLFALQKGLTPFKFDLDIHLVIDSLDDDGNLIWTKEKDTSVSYSFEVQVGPITETPKDMKMTYWGRTLAWGEHGTPLTSIGSDVKSIPLNFESYKVDTTLDYDTVDVEVRTLDGSDIESFRLTKSGNIWSGTLDREVGTPTKEDGVLQHLEVDEFIAVFRNPNLPLDTMEVRLSYTDAMTWELGDAAYFDNSANGMIDSLYVEIIGDRWEKNIDAMADAIILPTGRDLDKVDVAVDGSGIGFTLKQNEATKNTAVSSSDAIEIADDLDLPNQSLLLKTTVTPQDKMAPVALSALFRDSVASASEDYLEVTYTEEVTDVDDEAVHLFKNGASNSYDVVLQDPQSNGSVVTYLVKSVSGASNISDGDSLKINSTLATSIGDAVGNAQDNEDNIWAPITVETIEEGIKLKRAAYFDENADGYPDLIRVWTDGEPVNGIVDDIVANMVFANERDFSIVSSKESGDHLIEISVSSGSDASINTAIETDENLVVENKIELPGGAFLLSATVTPEDSMAPVAVTALFEDSIAAGSTDYLTVDFSESIEGGYDQVNPLLFKSSGGVEFNCDLAKGVKNSEQVVWEVSSISGYDRIRTGDSLWIHDGVSGPIGDALDNEQLNALNKRCPINVEIATGKVQITEAVWLDGDADGRVDTVKLTFDMALESDWVEGIENALLFEGYRKLGIDGSSKLDGNILYIPVEETTTEVINTALESDEAIRLSEQLLLSPDWALSAGTVGAVDGLAPVALSAELIDSIAPGSNDYLTTVFSEKIGDGYTHKNALKFITSDGTEYQCELEDAKVDGNQIVWRVNAVDGTERVQNGDSLWINDEASSPLSDQLENAQENALNLRCPISVVIAAGEVVANEALWLDGDGDGRTDTIKVTFNMNIKSDWISTIENAATIEGPRDLKIDGASSVKGKTLYIPVEENMSQDPRTDILEGEAITWSDQLILDSDWALMSTSLDAVDGMAPVILSATCTDTVRHYIKGKTSSDEVIDIQDLEVVFSEDVSDITEKRALTFIRENDDFRIDLNLSSIDNENACWKIEGESKQLSEGDSARINSSVSEAIGDLLDNKQATVENRTVLIDFVHHRDTVIEVVPYTLIPKIIHLNSSEELPEEIFDVIPELEEAMTESGESLSEFKLALLGLEPDEFDNVSPFDEFSAEVAIVDVVGNSVYGPVPMVVKESGNGPEGLYRLWNGKNGVKRFVGSGGYLVIYSIEINRYGGGTERYERKAMVTVQSRE